MDGVTSSITENTHIQLFFRFLLSGTEVLSISNAINLVLSPLVFHSGLLSTPRRRLEVGLGTCLPRDRGIPTPGPYTALIEPFCYMM